MVEKTLKKKIEVLEREKNTWKKHSKEKNTKLDGRNKFKLIIMINVNRSMFTYYETKAFILHFL